MKSEKGASCLKVFDTSWEVQVFSTGGQRFTSRLLILVALVAGKETYCDYCAPCALKFR